MRPIDLPPAERFSHGTRSRYVSGCRCADCKRSNVDYYHRRQVAKNVAAPSVTPSGPAGEGVIVRGGVNHKVRTCPGAGGAPCVRSPAAWLRGQHHVCGACVERVTVWNGDVDAAPVRAHLAWLSEQGVGYKSAAVSAGVGRTVVAEILSGEKTALRAQTAKALLSVTPAAIAGHANVAAHSTWDLLKRLLAEGLTRGQIARLLGRKIPALQLQRTSVLASTAADVSRLYDAIMDVGDAAPEEAPCVLEILRSSPRPLTVRELAVRLGADPIELGAGRAAQRVLRCLVRLKGDRLAQRRRGARGLVRWSAAAPARNAGHAEGRR